jgi:hypothetical protein
MMKVIHLCGKTMYLREDVVNPGVFRSLDKEWTGTVDGDTTTLTNSDGWQFVYLRGHIQRLKTAEGRTIKWVYQGNLITELCEEGKEGQAPFRVNYGQDGHPDGFEVNGKMYLFSFGKRPVVQHISNQNLVGGLESSLSALNTPQGFTQTFHFEVDKDLHPTLTVNNFTDPNEIEDQRGETTFIWDPVTRHLQSDGLWKYDAGPVPKEFGVPKLTRINGKGESEFVAADPEKGTTIQKSLEEGTTRTTEFTSPGPLYGKVRQIEKLDTKGVYHMIYHADYNEAGDLIRKSVVDDNGMTTVSTFAKNGAPLTKTTSRPADPAAVAALDAKEKALLAAVSAAAPKGKFAVDGALEQLAFFYIHTASGPKAIELLPQIANRDIAFAVKVSLIIADQTLTRPEKKQRFQALLTEYPIKKNRLEKYIAFYSKP